MGMSSRNIIASGLTVRNRAFRNSQGKIMIQMTFAKRAVALAVLSGAAVGAYAADYDLMVLTPGDPPKSFNAFHGGGGLINFNDNFLFELLLPGLTSGSLIDIAIPSITGAAFTSATLYAGTPMAPGAVVVAASGSSTAMSFMQTPTPAGKYYLNVTGNSIAGVSYGAAYNGSINVAIAPVPEPESYAMLLAGLGVMGAIAVRRNKSKKQD